MPVQTPKRRPAFKPIGKLRSGNFGGGKKSVGAELNLTAMVDMLTTIVVFLLQSFAASGDLNFASGITLPEASMAELLNERGPVVAIVGDRIIVEGVELVTVDPNDPEPGFQPIADELTAIREREQKLYNLDPTQPYEGHVVIQADQTTDFMIMRKLIYSVNQAGWIHLQFAVTKPDAGGAPVEE